MKIAIHHTANIHPHSYSFKWIETLRNNGIEIGQFDFKNTDIIEKVRGYDGVMWHWFHTPEDKIVAPYILNSIETILKIPTFPNFESRWHYDEKIAQHYLLDAIEAPKIKTWIFFNMEEALEFSNNATYPLITKLSVGAGSSNVIKLNDKEAAIKRINRMFTQGITPYTENEFAKNISYSQKFKRIFKLLMNDSETDYLGTDYHLLQKGYIYFQEFLPNNKNDIRITVIGDRAFGFLRYNRPGDFRASGSGILSAEKKKIPIDAIKISHQISKEFNFQSMSYDFLVDNEGKFKISEISYAYVDKAIYDCPGYWDSTLKFHKGHLWPEEAQVQDFIKYVGKYKK